QSTLTEGSDFSNGDNPYILPSGIDSNNDGWDDIYDGQFGGTYYEAIDTDNDGTPDYLDDDSDDDLIPDSIEGWDENADGVADVLPSGLDLDSDKDGLDNNYDTVNGWSQPNNATGSNAILQDTPDDVCIDGELFDGFEQNGIRDWRELKLEIPCTTVRPCEFFIPNGFSPNDDGTNDYFWINFEDCPLIESSKIEIYNRWGNLVYKKDNYGNDGQWWDGRANVGWTIGNDRLPPATYFYILYYKGERDADTGTIFLNK
ncbi:MAG: gliding motility-associated C-terminal domain-containing protein, partial [Bacteroidetes bacterium]|nr:gliding motility-associated C-terminal domain-containing protein [Bacteroidota bacterium]